MDHTSREAFVGGKTSELPDWFVRCRFALENPARLISGRPLGYIASLKLGHLPLGIPQFVGVHSRS